MFRTGNTILFEFFARQYYYNKNTNNFNSRYYVILQFNYFEMSTILKIIKPYETFLCCIPAVV